MEDRLLEQVRNVGVMERVNDAATVPLADDKAEMPKHPQLVRHRRALHPNPLRELVHGAGAVTQPSEDSHPARSCQRLHRLRDLSSRCSIDNGRATVSLDPVTHHEIIPEQRLNRSSILRWIGTGFGPNATTDRRLR